MSGIVSLSGVILFMTASAAGAPVGSFDDIKYWVGTGENSAALALDWDGHSGQDDSLTWGFRWDGTATGEDMLLAVLQSDPRLHAKLGGFGNQIAVFGIGYDASGDGQFDLDDGTLFDEFGIAQTSPADGSQPLNTSDWYSEGWFLGYWYHAIGSTTNAMIGEAPGEWLPGSGLSARTLSHGDWDSLAYKNTTDAVLAAASDLNAAEETTQPGDYNRNGQIDAGDFTLWRDRLGATELLPGFGADGDFNGVIENNDYDVWLAAFSGQSATQPNVPEPATGIILPWMVAILFFTYRRNET